MESILQKERTLIDTKTDAGDTALHIAASLNHDKTIIVLLKYKANVNELNNIN